ncbi:MAG: hypothetical protein N3A58_01265 [Spirochaetes bacterium]|nr:hypothetical protein [Spirochaetota bacterium]
MTIRNFNKSYSNKDNNYTQNILIIYYTLTGTCEKVANLIKETFEKKNINIDLLKIKDVNERKGILGFLRSGYEALFEKLPEIEYDEIEFNRYNLFIIISPTWAGRLASPMRSFLNKNGKKLNNVVFISLAADKYRTTFLDMEKFTQFPKAKLFLKQKEIDLTKITNFFKNIEDQN